MSCSYLNEDFVQGQSFASEDGCNTCSCSENGGFVCTTMDCGMCTLEACGVQPEIPEVVCEDGTTAGIGECEPQPSGICGWTTTQCEEKKPSCVNDGCPSTEASCDGNIAVSGTTYMCDEDTGLCTETGTGLSEDCWELEMLCENGDCVEANPCEFMLCETGSTCYEGECYQTYCEESCGSPCDNPSPSCVGVAYCNPYSTCVCGVASEGECSDTSCSEVDCGEGYLCEEGECVYSPCDGVDCGEPCSTCAPNDESCQDVIGPAEACNGEGLCVLNAALKCEEEDLCADVICLVTQASCDGDTALSGTYSECEPETGACLEAPGLPPQDCAETGFVCSNGACVKPTGPCDSVDCPSSPPSCDGNFALSGFISICDTETGECLPTPGAPPQDCAAMGMVCVSGYCTDSPCDKFVPPCTDDSECPGKEICLFDGCNPSACDCDPLTGDIICTADCSGGICGKDDGCGLIACLKGYSCEAGECIFDPCKNVPCGESCSLCEPGTEPCPQNFVGNVCDPNGECISELVVFDCPDDKSCVPGSVFDADDECNTCTCPDSGITALALCTKKACIDICEPGSTFDAMDGCNTCICPETGLTEEASCTELVCLPDEVKCGSSKDCKLDEFCDFANDDCGITKMQGVCTPSGVCPKAAPAIPVEPEPSSGLCGCNGVGSPDACMGQSFGNDVMKFGGCLSKQDPNFFACGEGTCAITEQCNIHFDGGLLGMPIDGFTTSCEPLSDLCLDSPSCNCAPQALTGYCFDKGGNIIVFVPND